MTDTGTTVLEASPVPPSPRPQPGPALKLVQSVNTEQLPEQPLCHYTSAEGLRGIVSGSSIRFSDVMFLNDGSEVHYGNEMLRRLLGDFMSGKPEGERQVADRLMAMVERDAATDRPIVFCLSSKPNLLNQWRDYGKDVVPYCIEFIPQALVDGSWTYQAVAIKLIYNQDTQVRLLTELMSQLYNEVKQSEFSGLEPEGQEQVLSGLVIELRLLLLHYKDPAFQAEDEWRLVSFGAWLGGQVIEYRTSPLGVVPFVSRQPRAPKGLLPISKVWVGPSPYGEVSKDALDIFLKSHGYNVPTEASKIQAR